MTSGLNNTDSAAGSATEPSAPLPADEQRMPLKMWGKWALAALIVGLLIYPIVQRIRRPAGDSQAATLSPADAQVQKSLELYQAGKYQESVAAGKEALRLKPGNALAYNNVAVAYLQLKNYDEALANVKEAIRIQPDLALAQNNLAWILRERAGGTATTPPAPGTPDYYIDQSLQEYQAGQFQQSIDMAQDALKLSPGMPEAYNNIAAGYIALGMWDKGIENAQLALRARPDFERARNNLNWALFKKNGSQPTPK